MKTEIKYVFGHYEVYIDGEFHCSADTYKEACQDVYELESETINNTKLI